MHPVYNLLMNWITGLYIYTSTRILTRLSLLPLLNFFFDFFSRKYAFLFYNSQTSQSLGKTCRFTLEDLPKSTTLLLIVLLTNLFRKILPTIYLSFENYQTPIVLKHLLPKLFPPPVISNPRQFDYKTKHITWLESLKLSLCDLVVYMDSLQNCTGHTSSG